MKIKKVYINTVFFVYMCALLVFLSCHKSDNEIKTEKGLFTKRIMVDNLSRRYAIYIPKDIDNMTVPLVFELHGGGVYIEDMTGESGYKTPYKLWMNLAETEKFIVVYPEGVNGAYNKPTWNDCREDCVVNSNANDVKFIETLIDNISNNYNINQEKVYVSGTSNGGFMALRLAVELSDKISAVSATVSAMPLFSSCNQPDNPISILFINGTDDNNMPYNGGYVSNPPNPEYGSAQSTENSINFWVDFNSTNVEPTVYTFPDLDFLDGGIVEKFEYKNGKQNTEVILYKVNGGGHSAPSIKT